MESKYGMFFVQCVNRASIMPCSASTPIQRLAVDKPPKDGLFLPFDAHPPPRTSASGPKTSPFAGRPGGRPPCPNSTRGPPVRAGGPNTDRSPPTPRNLRPRHRGHLPPSLRARLLRRMLCVGPRSGGRMYGPRLPALAHPPLEAP